MASIQPIEIILHLCRGDVAFIRDWVKSPLYISLSSLLPLLVVGSAVYGATLGLWHGPEMAFYVALKFPLAILFTLLLNALINGIFAGLLGSGIGIRQSFQFPLIAFTIFAIIVASLSPVLAFINLNNASPGDAEMAQAYRVFLTFHVLLIAFAGIVSHYILLIHVRHFASTKAAGTRTFLSWLIMNLLVGAEIMHTLRPFFGAPKLNIEFLREEMFERNFYESLYHILRFIT